MHIYGATLILYALSLTCSNTLKGPYCKALIFLPRPCSLYCFRCNQTCSPSLNIFSILCWSFQALHFSCDFLNVSFTCKWIYVILSMKISSFNSSHLFSSFSLPCCPYITSKGESDTYPMQVLKGDLQVEVWTPLF
jgi:hypothetical protein